MVCFESSAEFTSSSPPVAGQGGLQKRIQFLYFIWCSFCSRRVFFLLSQGFRTQRNGPHNRVVACCRYLPPFMLIAADLAPHVGHEVPFCGSKVVRAVFHGSVCCTCGQRLPDVRMVSKVVSRASKPNSDVQFDEDESAGDHVDDCDSPGQAAVGGSLNC